MIDLEEFKAAVVAINPEDAKLVFLLDDDDEICTFEDGKRYFWDKSGFGEDEDEEESEDWDDDYPDARYADSWWDDNPDAHDFFIGG